MNIKQFISQHRKTLEVLDLELLLSFVLKKERNFLFLNTDYELNDKEIEELSELIEKRREGFSVAVLVGEKEFYGRNFFVNENVLIPRPETESLITFVINEIKNYKLKIKNGLRILDIGTGSGIIPITLSLELRFKNYKLKTIGIDISKKALEVARKNADKFGVDVEFLESDLLSVFAASCYSKKIFEDSQDALIGQAPFLNVITANLPYVEDSYLDKSISKEPDLALYSGEDGLDHYRKLFMQLKDGIIDFKFLFMEMSPYQTKTIAKLFSEIGETSIIKDFSGKERIVKVIKTT